MAKPRKTKYGTYQIQVYMGLDASGKRIYHKQSFPAYREAVQAIAQKQLEKATEQRLKKHHTVASGLSRFISSIDAIHSPTIVAGYLQLARNAFTPIQHIQLEQLTSAHVQECVNWYAENHSPKTVKNAFGLLCKMMRFLEVPPPQNISLPANRKSSIQIPTDEQLVSLLNSCEHPGMRQAILLAAGAGMRRSEIAGLEWPHIHFGSSTIEILQAMVKTRKGEWVIKDTKTLTSTRILAVGPEIMEGFKDLQTINSKYCINLTPDAITRRFERLCKKLGYDFRFHDLRHYQASIMLAEGIPDKYAMERMGHSSTNMLRNVYQHTITSAQQEFNHRLNQNISSRLSSARQTDDSDLLDS